MVIRLDSPGQDPLSNHPGTLSRRRLGTCFRVIFAVCILHWFSINQLESFFYGQDCDLAR
jgi:hypothetical protein